jgi:hypothetical protein
MDGWVGGREREPMRLAEGGSHFHVYITVDDRGAGTDG